MINALVATLVYIAILCVIGYAAIALWEWATKKPVPPPVVIIFRAFIAVICLLLLLQLVTGAAWVNWPYLRH